MATLTGNQMDPSGPAQRLFQDSPAKSKVLAVPNP